MKLDKLTDVLSKLLPPELGTEVKSQVELAVSRQLQDMGVVTREQFDIQKRVLQKTRTKLVELEEKLRELDN